MFIPGMRPISCFCAGLFPGFRVAAFGLRVPDIFIPGMFAILCFFEDVFFLVVFLFALLFGVALGFALLMPGIFDMSCWAGTATLQDNRSAANRSAHTLPRKMKSNALVLFIFPRKPS